MFLQSFRMKRRVRNVLQRMAHITISSPDDPAVAAALGGMTFLDQVDPGWWRTDRPRVIDLAILNQSDQHNCVLAQWHGSYQGAVNCYKLTPHVIRLGFAAARRPGQPDPYPLLTQAWRDLIRGKRRSEKRLVSVDFLQDSR